MRSQLPFQLILIHLLFEGFVNVEMSVDVTVEPSSCICPNQSYTCRADSVIGMTWISDIFTEPITYSIVTSSEENIERNGVLVQFSDMRVGGDLADLTSQLFITDIYTVNGSTFTCDASTLQSKDSVMITACVIGPASAPTDLSVMCDSSSAVVSFQPPVHGGECVDYYVVTAVSERNIECHATRLSEPLIYSCSLPQENDVNEYNFTIHAVIRGINYSHLYNGSVASDCCLPFPENVTAYEKECGMSQLVNVMWQNSHLTSVTPNITVQSKEGFHYDEMASSKEFHQLTLNYSVTRLLEISVTFSSHVCSKTTVTQYRARGVLTGVSVSGTTLIIQSRDCIASPENYRIVATFTDASTELVNISFNSTIEHDVVDEVMPNTQYSITVVLVETTSNTVIDERTTSFTTPSEPEPGVTEAVIPNTGDRVTYIAVGAGVGGGILIVMTVIVVGIVVTVILCTVGSRRDLSTGPDRDAELSATNAVHQSETTAVVYDYPSDVVAGTGPDTSENVAYGVSKRVLTTPNPAYDVVQM